MSPPVSTLLAINAGSSSIKFAHYTIPAIALLSHGEISGIGGANSVFAVQIALAVPTTRKLSIPDAATAVKIIVDWMVDNVTASQLVCVVHRIVHGGARLRTTQDISDGVLEALYALRSDDSEHMPQEIQLIEALRQRFPWARQLACFDSTFHASMPAVASMLPVPRHFFEDGIKRLGYHGLSCQFLMKQLQQLEPVALASGKVVLAHLGGGASITAVENGESRDTTMGLTPSGGIPMSNRCGDIDPGFSWHCTQHEKMTDQALHLMLNRDSGLRGISGSTGDMMALLEREAQDPNAAQAVDLFCYQARKSIAAMAGALGGIDVLVFAGGIGEHAPVVRERICAKLAHLGVVLDEQHNRQSKPVISQASSRVLVRIISTDEQWMLAKNAVARLVPDIQIDTENEAYIEHRNHT